MKPGTAPILSAACAALLMSCASASDPGRIKAAGTIGGDPISSEVDSEIARYFMEEYLQGKRTDVQFDSRIRAILEEMKDSPITNEKLKAVADRTSLDFGAMLFAHLQTERNLAVKKTFLREYEAAKQGGVDLRGPSKRYKIVLVPGLFHRSKPETKGDLREVKEVLAGAGFEVVSAPILDAGTVEENADIIADFIKSEPAGAKKIIIVSTSKGGPDTLQALGRALDAQNAEKVSMWFSVGGALRGSYIADRWAKRPRRWLASVAGVFNGFSADMVESLSVEASVRRIERLRIPRHIRVIHFVGVPLSGTVIDEVRGAYRLLRPYGPNDGITLLSDEILDGSTVITALGLDHWYRDPDLKRKILALVATITKDD